MLDSYENRIGYMLAFGVIITAIARVFVGDDAMLFGVQLNKRISEVVKDYSFIGSKYHQQNYKSFITKALLPTFSLDFTKSLFCVIH